MWRTSSSGLATQILGKGKGKLAIASQRSPKFLGTHHEYEFGGNSSQDHQYGRYRHRSSGSSRYSSTLSTIDGLGFIPGRFNPLSYEDDGTSRHRGKFAAQHRGAQRRLYHVTPPSERAVAIILSLATVSAVAYAGSSAIQSYKEWKAAQPTEEELEAMRADEEKDRAEQEAQHQAKQEAQQQQMESDGPRQNVFRAWFDVGSKYYEGGFEDTMTKREAALILGVRESSSPQRIKDAHRKLLILNHPDTGGSTYISGKINEAKELLLKGKQRV
jgi:DnaJ family protein C protein 19